MDGVDDLAAVDALQVDARDAEVGVPKLALDHDSAKVESDQFDGRTLAQAARRRPGSPGLDRDERTRVLRRLTPRRTQLVLQRTGPRTRSPRCWCATLKGRPAMRDLFGKRGRLWLAELELPGDERDTVKACLRQVDFLSGELAHVDRQLADQALASNEFKRLMTIPGIDVTTAATLIAAIGNVRRFPSASGWSATSAWTRACVHPEPALAAKAGSPNRGPAPPGTCSSRRPGQQSRPRVLYVRSTSACQAAAKNVGRSASKSVGWGGAGSGRRRGFGGSFEGIDSVLEPVARAVDRNYFALRAAAGR